MRNALVKGGSKEREGVIHMEGMRERGREGDYRQIITVSSISVGRTLQNSKHFRFCFQIDARRHSDSCRTAQLVFKRVTCTYIVHCKAHRAVPQLEIIAELSSAHAVTSAWASSAYETLE